MEPARTGHCGLDVASLTGRDDPLRRALALSGGSTASRAAHAPPQVQLHAAARPRLGRDAFSDLGHDCAVLDGDAARLSRIAPRDLRALRARSGRSRQRTQKADEDGCDCLLHEDADC